MYLVLFSTLYMSAYHLGDLLFDIINATFPDPADRADLMTYRRMSMRWSISWLIVAFPTFLYTSWLVAREHRGGSQQAALEGSTVADLPDAVRRVERPSSAMWSRWCTTCLAVKSPSRFLLKVLVVAFIARLGVLVLPVRHQARGMRKVGLVIVVGAGRCSARSAAGST